MPLFMTRRLNRIYVEITNQCNRACSFCPPLKRPRAFMPLDFFQEILPQLKIHAEQIFLHVMGEPLLHPQLSAFISAAENVQLPVNITTNGLLLGHANSLALANPIVRRINISLHSILESENQILIAILKWAKEFHLHNPEKQILFRLWNGGVKNHNSFIISEIEKFFMVKITSSASGIIPLAPKLSLHFDAQFEWPAQAHNSQNEEAYCLGLLDQLAILVDGTVVPCCLDAQGDIPLGNLHQTTLTQIRTHALSQKIIRGFKTGHAVMPLCQQCSYRLRFNKN